MLHPLDQPILRIVDHAVGAVFFHTHHNGRLLVLAHEYTGRGRDGQPYTTLRMPFGKGKPGENIGATLNREMIEEVAADPSDFDFEVLSPAPLYWEVVPDDETGERTHLKAVFPARHSKGHIRDFMRVDDPGTDDEETHGPLQWIEVSRLLTRMWKEKAPRVHRLAVVSALLWISRQNARVARFYYRLRTDRARDVAHFEPYHAVVNEYLARG
jgi:hypothetical protein